MAVAETFEARESGLVKDGLVGVLLLLTRRGEKPPSGVLMKRTRTDVHCMNSLRQKLATRGGLLGAHEQNLCIAKGSAEVTYVGARQT